MLDITIGLSGLTTTIERLAGLSLAAQVFGSSSQTIRSDDPVVRYVEEGTRAHDIYPRNAQALFWPGAAHPVMHVHHPGTKANRFMERGLDAARAPVEAMVAARFDDVAAGRGSNYTKIMDDAGQVLLAAVKKETPVGPTTPTRTGGTLRSSLYLVNGR